MVSISEVKVWLVRGMCQYWVPLSLPSEQSRFWRDSLSMRNNCSMNIVGGEAAQAALKCTPHVVARGAQIVGPINKTEGGLGRDQRLVAPGSESLAQHLFRAAI